MSLSQLGAVSRSGQSLLTGDTKALFLKVFSGEVLQTFEEKNVMKGLHTTRTIASGKSAQFPCTGIAYSAFHVVGDNILDDSIDIAPGNLNDQTRETGGKYNAPGTYLSQIAAAERVISIDELMLSAAFVPDIDDMMNHYDTRSIYASEIGRALARAYDKRVMQVGVLAARATSNFAGSGAYVGFGGDAVVDSLMRTDGAAIVSAIFEAAEILDEKDIPEDNRVVLLSPEQYYLVVQQKDVIDRDYGGEGNGTLKDGTVKMVAGIQIVKTNHLPTEDFSGYNLTGANNTYNADFSDNAGLVFHRSAIGTVKLKDLTVETDRKIEYQGDLIVAKYALGTGILRPESAVELSVAP